MGATILVAEFLDGEGFLSIILLGILFSVGSRFSEHNPPIRMWGVRSGAVAAIITAFLTAMTSNTGVLWVVVRSAVIGMVCTVATWIVLPLIAFLYHATFGRIVEGMARVASARAEQMKMRQRTREQQQWEEDERRLAPERERAAREAEERRRNDERARASTQRRRDDARAKCELLYTVYAPEICKRFSKQMLDAFIRNYMNDSRSPEEVEERARHLEEILAEHRSAVRPAPRFKNIAELANWYVTEKQRIEELPVDDMFKEQHLVQLHTLYAELTQHVMEQQS